MERLGVLLTNINIYKFASFGFFLLFLLKPIFKSNKNSFYYFYYFFFVKNKGELLCLKEKICWV